MPITDLHQAQRKYESLKIKLMGVGYVCSGSVMLLYRKCGRANCACQSSKKARHGPYYIWTRKVNGKTVTRTLSEEQSKRCLQYIENLRNFEELLEAMKGLAAELLALEYGQ